MLSINFITNQPLERESGGWCGLSRGLYHAISERTEVNFVGPIEPPISGPEKLFSKSLRLCGLKGDFYYFSERRLLNIAKEVDNQAPKADFDLFFGATSWLACIPRRPYAACIDALFPTYLRIYGAPEEFRKADLNRIRVREENWLREASHIFWTSDWAKEDGSKYEELSSMPSSTIGIGGNFVPPTADDYAGEKRLLFISMRFAEKGGNEAFEAFKLAWKKDPEIRLVIIGGVPPRGVMSHPGVEYLGLIDKANPTDLKRFRNELARAFCLVHPTRLDTMGHVLIEAGYWGCPAIAPARFGIPEIISDKISGLLLPEPFKVKDIYECIELLLINREDYYKMRVAARSRALNLFTYDVIAEKIVTAIHNSLCD